MHSMLTFCVVASLVVSQAAISNSKRVAMLPVPFTSHAKYHTDVASALLALGHEVWLILTDEILEKGVLDTAGCQIIEYTTVPNMENAFMVHARDAYFEKRPSAFGPIRDVYKRHMDILLTNKTFMNLMGDLNLDLIVIDTVLRTKMLTIIPYRLGVPFAVLGTHYDFITQRVPFSPPVTPFPLLPFTDDMTFLERLQTVMFYVSSFLNDPFVDGDAVSRYAPEMPYLPVDLLVARAEIWLVETDHILDYPRPSIPNVKLIGGTAARPAKTLPAEFKSFMDGAEEGVVVVSFGSYVLQLPQEINQKIIRALRRLPFRSVFRSSLSSPDPDKIMTSPWLPQNDLLGHRNTKVFLSHCGKNGQYEALYHAVPVICTPLFTDQFYNAERMRVKGMAERLDLNTVSEEELEAIILKVGTERRYKEAISTASELFRIEFGVPMKRAAFWLDHVMKYGSAHMRSVGQSIPYYQFIGLDIMAVFLSVVLVVVAVIISFILLICRLFCHKFKTE